MPARAGRVPRARRARPVPARSGRRRCGDRDRAPPAGHDQRSWSAGSRDRRRHPPGRGRSLPGPGPSRRRSRRPGSAMDPARPVAAIRSRRLRWRGGRRRRGLARPAARRICWRLGRLISISSRSARSSVRCVSLTSPYVVRRSSTTRSRSAGSSRRPEGRPRLPWTSPAGPSRSKATRSRHSWRSESPTRSAASVIVSSCFRTRLRTQARRCSLDVIVIVVSIRGD